MSRLEQVYHRIDKINEEDPNKTMWDGQAYPKELLYGQRMTEMLSDYKPKASELLKIAARGQHIKRWSIPREDFPMDRKGYLKWRTQLKLVHADLLGQIMEELDYNPEEVKRVKVLVSKNKLKTDHETQVLEDVICLVFLKFYFSEFADKHDDDKVIDILQKTWGKMSEPGHNAALRLELDDRSSALIKKALA